MTTTYSDLALRGVSDIAAGFPPGGLAFNEQVKAAIEAGLAYDADPTYWASDMNIGRSAALTEAGLVLARERGYLAPCVCEGCKREVNPATYEGYCQGCLRTGNRRSGHGSWGGWINGKQCYDHYLQTHPAVVEERKRLLQANQETRRSRHDYARHQRYNDALGYIDPSDERSEEPKGVSWHYVNGQPVWNEGYPR